MTTTMLASMTSFRRKQLLKKVEKQVESLKTMVRQVALEYTSALFVFGPGGLGKSHHITEELDALCGDDWIHHTAATTPRGLFDALAAESKVLHLFEDCEEMYKNAHASSILRAACGSPRGRDRVVTWEAKGFDGRITFKGGIIIVSNQDLSNARGPLAAVASRFRPIEWNLTTDERMAMILEMADAGWGRGEHPLTPDECREVANFLIVAWEQNPNSVRIDLRTYAEHCLPAFSMAKHVKGGTSWQEIVMAKIIGKVTEHEGQAQRTDRLQDVAVRIAGRTDLKDTVARLAAWKEETGLGQVIYYRHLKNAKANGKG